MTTMRVIRRAEMSNSAPAPGLTEFAAGKGAGTEGLWLARITASPGSGVSPVHHHRESEALVCVLSGTLTFVFGPELRDRVDVGPGDFLFIPPQTLHAEANLGHVPADVIMARSTPDPISEYHRELRVPAEVLYPIADEQ
ncbi:MAG TPA: cupin domain-containing protein [Candidatus Dormibacteraeota bacterium]|jgi:uncharacterized RmlC-like cupin family protein|nr:cupin domain-containing protein [Candidatus Dormibacteraeota bacterium]